MSVNATGGMEYLNISDFELTLHKMELAPGENVQFFRSCGRVLTCEFGIFNFYSCELAVAESDLEPELKKVMESGWDDFARFYEAVFGSPFASGIL